MAVLAAGPVDSRAGVPIDEQNATSANAIANRFLNDISTALKGGAGSEKSGSDAFELMFNLLQDPVQPLAVKDIAAKVNDAGTMSGLDLTGKVERDKTGNITAIDFTNSQTADAYQGEVLGLEKQGLSPTQAELKATKPRGTVTFYPESPFVFE